MTVTVAATPLRMGRPPLSQKSVTQPTMVRLTEAVRERIIALVGDKGMSAFIREAVDAELKRREKSPSPPRPSAPRKQD